MNQALIIISKCNALRALEVARLNPFCDLINLFSLTSNDKTAATKLWEEIWGCVNYLKVPYNTIMEMPVYVRKFWIAKHNAANSDGEENVNSTAAAIAGMSMNSFAEMEQMKQKNRYSGRWL